VRGRASFRARRAIVHAGCGHRLHRHDTRPGAAPSDRADRRRQRWSRRRRSADLSDRYRAMADRGCRGAGHVGRGAAQRPGGDQRSGGGVSNPGRDVVRSGSYEQDRSTGRWAHWSRDRPRDRCGLHAKLGVRPGRRCHRNRSSRRGVVKTTEGGCPAMCALINGSMSTLVGNIWARRDVRAWRNVRAKSAPYAAVPLRLIVGYGLLAHGLAKWHNGPEAFAAILHAIGVPAPQVMAWLTIATEILSGIAILIGGFVSLVSIPSIILLTVAVFTVHLPYGFSSIKLLGVSNGRAQFGPPGYECDLLYI